LKCKHGRGVPIKRFEGGTLTLAYKREIAIVQKLGMQFLLLSTNPGTLKVMVLS
jgi:hypothetical protein